MTDPLQFKAGVADRWGAIENFHTYNGQNEDGHSHYDHGTDNLSDPGNLSNLSQFDSLVGCRSAVDKCIGLMQLKHAGKKWDEGVRDYLDKEVFALATNASPANNEV